VQNERHDYVAALQLFEKYLQQGGTEISAERREQVGREITALKGESLNSRSPPTWKGQSF
jgi:hypothetical protein